MLACEAMNRLETRSLPLRLLLLLCLALASACGGGSAAEGTGASEGASASAGSEEGSEGGGGASGEFQLSASDTAGQARGDHPSEIEATATEAAMRLFVVDPEAGALSGIVIKLTGADGRTFYTDETDSQGYAEVLVPVGQRYEIEYLSLGRRSTRAHVEVPTGPNQDIRLTLRYRRYRPPPRPAAPIAAAPDAPQAEAQPEPEPERLVLEGILFDRASATLRPESGPRLDRVVEYMEHRPRTRLRISGHTDSVGDPAVNMRLSEQRAQSVRDYLVEHGVDASRIEAVGYGDTRPVASNDTEEGRQQNRRIEAEEL